MNKGELIYLKMSNGDRVFLNINEIVVVLANRITMDNSDHALPVECIINTLLPNLYSVIM